MKQLKKILVPTDFSPIAMKAYLQALKLAKQHGAGIKIIHVYRADFGVPVPETMAYQMLEARKEEAENNMLVFKRLAPDSPYSDVVVETSIEMGFATDVVVEYTENDEEKIDLVVMGTKGEHNVADTILGSVASNVIKNSACPVLAIPEHASESEINEIAYATDLKSDTEESLSEAALIATLLDAKLHCVKVDTKAVDNSVNLKAFNELIQQLNIDANTVEIPSDTIAHGLNQYVHENGIDMILMYRPQRTLFESLFHSSVTKQVALHTTVPLLVFKK